MKVFAAILIGLSSTTISVAQSQSFEEYRQRIHEEFNRFKADKESEFNEFRNRVNAEYAEFMRQAWTEFKSKPATPVPESPEPPKPVVATPQSVPSNDPIPFTKVTPKPQPTPRPQPMLPDAEPQKPEKPTIPDKPVTPSRPNQEPVKPSMPDSKPQQAFAFDYYGTRCEVPLDASLRFTLRGIKEKDVSDAWSILSSDRYIPLIRQCIDCRDRMHISDWGYFRFVEQMSNAFLPSGKNESRLLQMFILTQSGYKVRIGRIDNTLVLLIPSTNTIYNYAHITISGTNYYVVDKSLGLGNIQVFNREFPKEQMFSLSIHEQPLLTFKASPARHFKSKHNPELDFDITVNRNLIDFYNEFPLSNHWDLYANASLSNEVKDQLYPTLREAVTGKTSVDAANILLHFVQTAFEYKTDAQQFGAERAFFADETFFYPYSDCEDRAILFSTLVRDLLGLDAVLLYYPGHLATAVRFESPVNGDYLTVDGRRYTVCDPTYINAGVGQTMPQLKNSGVEVIKL